MTIQERLLIILTTAVLLAICAYQFYGYMTIPVVYKSHLNQQCVKVIGGDYSCYNLPEKYQTTWVK